MATIIEGGLWTLTEAAAELMVEQGLIFRCDSDHRDAEEFDKPIYHIRHDKPDWFGFSRLDGTIRDAEKFVEHRDAGSTSVVMET